ncbi:MAG: glycosyltransferase family 1 protein [Mycobacteriales bacterium]|nr:glycosyltransferase family 1 protein [Mycobacteriales bacterium]
MRVGLLLEQLLAPVPGGTGRYSREIGAALARTGAVEVDGWVAAHRDTTAAEVDGVGGPHRLRLPRRPLVAAWERGTGPGVPCDVVHAPTPLAPPRRRTPLVVTVHDAVPWTHPSTLTPRGVRWHRRVVERAARDADLVVVPTHAVAAELRHHVRIAPDRLLVVGEGVSGELDLPPDADARAAAMDLPERFLLTVATLEPRKGLADLVRALADRAAPDVPLLCVGQPGWGDLASPEELAAQVGLPPGRVRSLGRVPDADLAVLLRRATALVVPSRAEGFGLPLLEAMAVGTPVVASRAPSLVEVAGGAAVHVDVAGLPLALREVVEDDAVRSRLRLAGPARAAAFTWDGAARLLVEAYRSLRA